MKKNPLLLIIIISIIVLLIVLFSYYLFIKDSPKETLGEDGGFFSFLPFGGGDIDTSNNNGSETTSEEPLLPIQNYDQKLRLISDEPVSGMVLLEKTNGTIVRYIEKATGHIYEVELFSPNKTRISNTTIPVVYDSLWNTAGNSLLATYLKEDNKTVDVYGLILSGTSTSTEISVSAIKFPPNIKDFSVFGNSLFYLQETESGSVGYTSNFDGTNKKQVLSHPIKEFLSQFVNSRTVALTTKPDKGSWGYLYFLDTNNGSMKLVLRKIYGLSGIVGPDANLVLFSENRNQVAMYLYNIKNNTTQPINLVSFPEKCVFSKKVADTFYCATPNGYIEGSSLGMWYKGILSTEDVIWKYNIKDDLSSIVSDLYLESAYSIDVVKPTLSPEEKYLLFINKRDGSLWSLDLTK